MGSDITGDIQFIELKIRSELLPLLNSLSEEELRHIDPAGVERLRGTIDEFLINLKKP
jgi:hypothetical protein